MIIALTSKEDMERNGNTTTYRIFSENQQGINHGTEIYKTPKGFKDWGLVWLWGKQYYMSSADGEPKKEYYWPMD